MTTIKSLNERRAKLRAELSEVDHEISVRHGQVDDPSDRPDNIPVPGHDKANPPPDPQPDPEIDPTTGKAVEDVEDDEDEVDTKPKPSAPVRTATAVPAGKTTATKQH